MQCVIVFSLGTTGLLNFRIRFRPPLCAVGNKAAPQRISTRDMLGFGFRGKAEGLVDFKSIVRIRSAHEIDWTRDDRFAHAIESGRINQDLRSIPVIQSAKPARKLNRFAARQERGMYAVL